MHHRKSPYILILTFLLGVEAFADVPAAQRAEVDHLLRYVELSHCVIDRNGTRHTGKEAVGHIQKKYDYFRDKIRSTEDFIELSAAKSTMSGKPYRVVCEGGMTTTTQDWLLGELRAYRAGRSTR